MPWLGKLFGGFTGFMIGGPIGAIIGAALGHGVDKNGPQDPYRPEFSGWTQRTSAEQNNGIHAGDRRQSIFFATVFACAGKIAMADGRVTDDEAIAVERFVKTHLKLGGNATRFAVRLFYEGARSSRNYDEIAEQFYATFMHDADIIAIMMELQFTIAMADGQFHPNEEKLLLRSKAIFHLNDNEYANIRYRYVRSGQDSQFAHDDIDVDEYYAVLGCSKQDSMETIKSKYRKMIQEYHPDKIVSKGLPEEFITFANTKFDEIQTAYEKIKAARGE